MFAWAPFRKGQWSVVIRPIDDCPIDSLEGSATRHRSNEPTVNFSGNGSNGVNSWNWFRDNISISKLQNPILIFPANSQHTISLIVSNGGCTDSISQSLTFNNELIAKFEVSDIICPEDSAFFINTSTGIVNSWLCDFGDG